MPFLCLPLCVCAFVLQVAEMHGELIEFNERLYRSLMAKDHLIVQMRQELIDLRGPVSDSTHTHTHTLISHTDFPSCLPFVTLPFPQLSSQWLCLIFISTSPCLFGPLLIFLDGQWLPIMVNCIFLEVVLCEIPLFSFFFDAAALRLPETACQSNTVCSHLFTLLLMKFDFFCRRCSFGGGYHG